MPIPTEVVGSLPRPTCTWPHAIAVDSTCWLISPLTDLQEAYADYDAGKISRAELESYQDRAAKDSVSRMEQAGEMFVTDGEQRASS